MDIKQRLQQVIDGYIQKDDRVLFSQALCHDALAEIQRLEINYASLSNAIDERSPLMRLADTLERIEKRMQTRWNLL